MDCLAFYLKQVNLATHPPPVATSQALYLSLKANLLLGQKIFNSNLLNCIFRRHSWQNLMVTGSWYSDTREVYFISSYHLNKKKKIKKILEFLRQNCTPKIKTVSNAHWCQRSLFCSYMKYLTYTDCLISICWLPYSSFKALAIVEFTFQRGKTDKFNINSGNIG